MLKFKKPKPELYYDITDVEPYLKEKYKISDKVWQKFSREISENISGNDSFIELDNEILHPENLKETELDKDIIRVYEYLFDEFGEVGTIQPEFTFKKVAIRYWW